MLLLWVTHLIVKELHGVDIKFPLLGTNPL